jgi:proteasome lid subunit RPN8/RPN11
MSIHRAKPLPELPATGHLIVTEPVLLRTQALLREAGGGPSPHEGLVWWFGRHVDSDTVVLACHRPSYRSGPRFVIADEAATGAASRAARSRRLGVLAQVHSHPDSDTRHSDGDDDLVFMPYEGMFSLVVGDYGKGSLLPDRGAGLHQFRDGHWVLIRQAKSALIVVPAEVAS